MDGCLVLGDNNFGSGADEMHCFTGIAQADLGGCRGATKRKKIEDLASGSVVVCLIVFLKLVLCLVDNFGHPFLREDRVQNWTVWIAVGAGAGGRLRRRGSVESSRSRVELLPSLGIEMMCGR